MLWRLVAKLMLKAMVPLIAVAGLFSYGVYMRGGDPSIMWKNIASGSADRVAGIFSGVQIDANRAVGALSSKASGGGTAGKLESTQVFTWQDADGVTHYSTSAPSSGIAQTLIVDPNVNVLAPVRAPVVVETDSNHGIVDQSEAETIDASSLRRGGGAQSGNHRNDGHQTGSNANSAAISEIESELGGTLPGVAGQLLSGQSDKVAEGGINPAQLIRLLQSAGN